MQNLFATVFFVISLCTAAFSLEAVTLHAIIVGDTNNYSAGKTIAKDIANIHIQLIDVAQATEMELNTIVIKGDSTTRRKVLKAIRNLQVDANDVVVAYFSTHGYREEDKTSAWPNLLFSNENNGLDLQLVIKKLKRKKPRLLISLVDACNDIMTGIDTKKALTVGLTLNKSLFNKKTKKNYRSLFLDSAGVVIASASAPGELAWATPKTGGLMTYAFIESLDAASQQSKKATWQDIFTQVEQRIDARLVGESMKQTPLYEIDLMR